MSSFAVAYSGHDFARARRVRSTGPQVKSRSTRPLRAWSEVPVNVAGIPLQAASGHPRHIKRAHLAILFVVALILHSAAAWYISTHTSERKILPQKTELNIEIVRPPKPIEPPKVEPPKPAPPKPREAQVLPQIQQSDPLPATVGESVEAPVAVAPVVSEPAPPAPEPVVTLPIGHAGYLNNPLPEYPAMAARLGWQGTVQLRVLVLATGKAGNVEVKKSSGRKILDDEAIRTVKNWQFTPAKRGDTPIDYWYALPVEFLL